MATFVVFALQNAVIDRKTNLLRSEAKYGILLTLPNSRNPNLLPIGEGFGSLFVFGDAL
jgi:hypothetical protein